MARRSVVLDNRGPSRIDEHRCVPWMRHRFVMNKPLTRVKNVAFVASQTEEAREAYARLEKRYGNCEPNKADVIVALGGDGLMLQTLHDFMRSGKPIYGMHRGTVGFLMNDYSDDGLIERISAAHMTVIHPLLMCAHDSQGNAHEHHAINEVSLFRQALPPIDEDAQVRGLRALAEQRHFV